MAVEELAAVGWEGVVRAAAVMGLEEGQMDVAECWEACWEVAVYAVAVGCTA